MNKLLAIIILSLPAVCLRAVDIHVSSQSDFLKLRDNIISAAEGRPSEIRVLFDSGKPFVFSHNMLNLSGMRFPETQLDFIGNGAMLTGVGFTEESWSPVYHASRKIQRNNKKKGEYVVYSGVVHADDNVTHILLTEWYQSRIYRVTSVIDGAVFFYAENGDELNMDMEYSGMFPRFKLLYSGSNVPSLDQGVKKGNAGRLLSTYGAEFKSMSFTGFVFAGNCNSGDCLLDLTDLSVKDVIICNCLFVSVHSDLIHVSSTANFRFENNNVRNCYRSGVVSDNKSKNTIVIGNSFESCGLGLDMSSCVDCCGTDYYVADNKFVNFGSRAISVGVYFTVEQTCRSSGIIERNELCYTSKWLDNLQEYTLMDTGAIYITTFSDDAVIRFNRIHDYSGMKDNRGIFCDDGSSGVSIYGNVVTGIPNSYAIDARRTPTVEIRSGGRKVNVNNFIGNNVLDGPVRFEGRVLGANCSKTLDYYLCLGGADLPERTLSAVSVNAKDVKVRYKGDSEGVVLLPAFSMWRIRRWKYYNEMKSYFKQD